MNDWLSRADLHELEAAVANSPIVLRRRSVDLRLADWANTRTSPDVDDVILAWLAGQARSAAIT